MKKFLLLCMLLPAFLMAQDPEPGTHEYKMGIVNGEIPAHIPATLPLPEEYTFLKTATTCQPDSIGCIIPIDFDTWTRVPFTIGGLCSGDNGWTSDDCSSDFIEFEFEYSVCGEPFSGCWVNTNGNLTFDAPLGQFTADGIPNNTAVMVAPFWGDVDFDSCGECWIYQTPTTFIATWLDVGYFSASCDKLNTFQVVLTNGDDELLGQGNNTAFYYCNMDWTTGSASGGEDGFGGSPAVVGINSGDNDAFAIIGNFDAPGFIYDGPAGENDGVDFLDNKFYLFDAANCSIESSCSIFDLEVTPSECNDDNTYELLIQFVPAGVGSNGFVVDINEETYGPFFYGVPGELTEIVIPGFTGAGQTGIEIYVYDLDDVFCGTDCEYDAPVCEIIECTSSAGQMPTNPVYVCAGGTASASASGQILDSDDVLVYALHTSPTSTPGDILDVNATGQFSIGSADTNTEYYISSIVGNSNADGGIDLSDPCLDISPGTPVVFLEPIEFLIDTDCDQTEGLFSFTASCTGGLPEYVPGAMYSVSDAASVSIQFGEQFAVSLGAFDGQVYSLGATDGAGCSTSFVSDPVDCIKTPIELKRFDGEVRANGNLISWTTGSETNNKFFAIEHSTNGLDFNEVGRLDGAGDSFEEIAYSFLHNDISTVLSYYRLKQIDFDGKSSTSNVIQLHRTIEGISVNSFTNPVSDVLTIQLSNVAKGQVSLYNLQGQKLITTMIGAEDLLEIDLSNFANGIYLLQIGSDQNAQLAKVIKQ